MDNFKVVLISDSEDHFKTGMALAFSKTPGGKAKYVYSDSERMVFFWSKPGELIYKDAKELPYPMGVETVTLMASEWLDEVVDYGTQPDHDGDNAKGFMIDNGKSWGHAGESSYGIVEIQPVWAMYGK